MEEVAQCLHDQPDWAGLAVLLGDKNQHHQYQHDRILDSRLSEMERTWRGWPGHGRST